MKGIGGHTRPNEGRSVEWETPPDILAALGPFDDDPCQPGQADGLIREWRGRVWLNPPYTRDIGSWLGKLAAHGNGIALIFARTETAHFHRHVWRGASAVLFLEGRLHFYQGGRRSRHNAGGPSCLVAYGHSNAMSLAGSGLKGALIHLRNRQEACRSVVPAWCR